MGPNGSGKSTLAYVLAGKADYEVTEGEVLSTARTCWRWSRTSAPPRACSWPSSIRWRSPASRTMTFLRTALNAQRKARGEEELTRPIS